VAYLSADADVHICRMKVMFEPIIRIFRILQHLGTFEDICMVKSRGRELNAIDPWILNEFNHLDKAGIKRIVYLGQ
jgi:hypothetical protein